MPGDPIDCGRCGQPHPRCVGHNQQGKPCGRWPKKGVKVCPRHGGHAPQVKAAAKRRTEAQAAAAAVNTYSLPRVVAPDVALLEEVNRSAGAVTFLAEQVNKIATNDLVWGVTEESEKHATEFTGTDTTRKAVPNVWLVLYQQERKHLADVCKAALAAGIAERQVRLAEQQGKMLADVIRRIMDRLDLSPEQQARMPDVVRSELRAIAA